MRTKIIAGFPGIGKSYSHKKRLLTSLDSDSSLFSWMINENGEKVRNPEFPKNYINHIKENIGKYEYIFVSTHKDVREALKDECIFFNLVFPGFAPLDEYIRRYQERGSSDEFIKLLEEKWLEWNHELHNENYGCKKHVLGYTTLEALLIEIDEKEL